MYKRKYLDNYNVKKEKSNFSQTSTQTNITKQMQYDIHGISFKPDFSAVIRDSCTYLEVTAETYLLAYKLTLITKNRFKLIFILKQIKNYTA